jgi:hypothetical protein
MRSGLVVRLIVAFTLLTLPVTAYAQEAAVSGTITDTSGAVLPGVTVRAVHEATGNSFETMTDELGTYKLAVRVGTLRISAEASGFQQPNALSRIAGRTDCRHQRAAVSKRRSGNRDGDG